MKKRVLTKKEYKLYKFIITASTQELYKFLKITLSRYNYKNIKTDTFEENYIIAEGTEPLALVAHMDTVFPYPPKNFFYDERKNVIWSPWGGVGDDRLGIFLILLALRDGFRPHIIFTNDEELGGLGAEELILDYKNCPFKQCYYLLELDRHGINDAVFYDCNNEIFEKYITNTFNFVKAQGIFSDISVICPKWEIAGVNLSIGYTNEHSYIEHVYLNAAFDTLNQVKLMIKSAFILKYKFEYIPRERRKCACCGQLKSNNDVFEVEEDNSKKYYCFNCVDMNKINWCKTCGKAFIGSENECQECRNTLNE